MAFSRLSFYVREQARFGVIRGQTLLTHWHSADFPAVMFVFVIAVVVAWVRSEDLSEMWLRAKDHVGVTRTGTVIDSTRLLLLPPPVCYLLIVRARVAWREELFKPVLPQHDVRNGLIAPGPSPNFGARSRPIVNFVLATLFPSMRHRPGA